MIGIKVRGTPAILHGPDLETDDPVSSESSVQEAPPVGIPASTRDAALVSNGGVTLLGLLSVNPVRMGRITLGRVFKNRPV